jgi:rubrerythrin
MEKESKAIDHYIYFPKMIERISKYKKNLYNEAKSSQQKQPLEFTYQESLGWQEWICRVCYLELWYQGHSPIYKCTIVCSSVNNMVKPTLVKVK